jgi:hypothetical protein
MYRTEDSDVYTRDEIVQELDEDTRKRLNMSAEEFARAVRLRKLPVPLSDVIDLLGDLNILDDDDPIYGGLPRNGAY